MCELLAISSRFPVTANLSLTTFAEHGGHTGPHRDGWGIVFYQGNDIQRMREVEAASDSDCVRFIAGHHLTSQLIISHLRHATSGERILANTHPFARELSGHMHVFAHNGNLPTLFEAPSFRPTFYKPLGASDSELAFCVLLDRLRVLWDQSPPEVSLARRLAVISEFAAQLRPHGPANFLYSDSEYLYVHGHRRIQEGTGRIEPPGLHLLERHCPARPTVDKRIKGLTLSGEENRTVLVASVPLSEEAWRPLAEGEIVVIKEGEVVGAAHDQGG